MTERDLYLHEYIDITAQNQWAYMEHAKAQAGHEKVDFELLGKGKKLGRRLRFKILKLQLLHRRESFGGGEHCDRSFRKAGPLV